MNNSFFANQPPAGGSDFSGPASSRDESGRRSDTIVSGGRSGMMVPRGSAAGADGYAALTEPMPETLMSTTYVPGFLRTQIGKIVRVEFLVGSQTTDRVGTLLEVGASYILLQDLSGAADIMCDLFAIKFVTIINDETGNTVIIP
ncbi:MAG: hypothetical protein LUG13_05155 [Oscillospiraceae bacterium]|nr:hypothetical protein [Oscillospiraceae bacterium]